MPNEGENISETPRSHIFPPYSAHPLHATPQALVEEMAYLAAERERFLFAEQIGGIGTFEWNIADNQVTWSPALEALYGLPPGGFEGKYEHWARYIHPADLPLVEASRQRTVNGEGAYQVEFRVIWPDGSIHWLLAKGDLYTYDPSQTKRILGINIDITERKALLKQSLGNSHFLAEASKYLSATLDYQESLAQVVNLAVSELARWCRIDLLEKDGTLSQFTGARTGYADPGWLRLSPEQTFSQERRAGVWQALQTGKSVLSTQITDELLTALANNERESAWLRAASSSFVMIVPIVQHNQAQGAITFISGHEPFFAPDAQLLMLEELAGHVALTLENARMYQDLQNLNTNLEALVMRRTEALLETADTLRLLNGELERSNQELQDFAHVASHDLQEPLRKIQAFGNLLAEEYSAELGDGHMYIERMRKAAARMQVLINDLLAFARVASKAQPFEPVDLHTVAQDVLDDLENRIQTSGGRVEVDPLPTIEADAFQMRQVLQNLLGNALKFQRPGVPPHVRISVTQEGSEQVPEQRTVQICVADNGIGFDEKYLDRIFTVFQRLHGKNEYEGTGIGLAVVRKIVLRHNGTITAKSEPGVGSTFFLVLPVTQTTKKEIVLD